MPRLGDEPGEDRAERMEEGVASQMRQNSHLAGHTVRDGLEEKGEPLKHLVYNDRHISETCNW